MENKLKVELDNNKKQITKELMLTNKECGNLSGDKTGINLDDRYLELIKELCANNEILKDIWNTQITAFTIFKQKEETVDDYKLLPEYQKYITFSNIYQDLVKTKNILKEK